MIFSADGECPADHDACGVGFVARLGAAPSREIVARALAALDRLSHRGGVDADGLSGDGAGLLLPIPENFFRARAEEIGIVLPRRFGLGMAFLPQGAAGRGQEAVEQAARRSGLVVLGWRPVPTDSSAAGPRALATLPEIWQCFLAANETDADFERRLLLLRKRVESEASASVYFSSLSTRSVVYKGLLSPRQLAGFYRDLDHPDFVASFSIFHQRYSTNTQPSWKLAQPFRLLGHNGEINTLSGNRRWLRARARAIRESLGAGEGFSAIEDGTSDSGCLDNALELLLHQGYGIAAAISRLIPPAWEADDAFDPELRGFFEAEARRQEPWDGPAALVFSDGRRVGVKLDRNGLRPLRFTLTESRLIVLGSEAGIADLTGERRAERGRLGPGEMLLVDPAKGILYRGSSLSNLIRKEAPPLSISSFQLIPPAEGPAPGFEEHSQNERLAAALGWTADQFRLLYAPLPQQGKEAIWSMGDDAPPAFLSSARRPLWDYLKQRFAQVTNPPIDPLRESHVMSLRVFLGDSALASPLVDATQMPQIEAALAPVLRIDLTFPAREGVAGGLRAIERIIDQARNAPTDRLGLVLVTDRDASAERSALPVLLGLAATWKALCEAGGSEIPLVVETGQAIETHHIAMLVAAGASAVFPYLALALAEAMAPAGVVNYRAGVELGLRKVLARMGISALSSYRNSQLFEVVGLDRKLAAEFFPDAAHVLAGRSLEQILAEMLDRHGRAFGSESSSMTDAGLYRFRQGGERHSSSPELTRRLHGFLASGGKEDYRAFESVGQGRDPVAIRDLLEIVEQNAVPIEEVESESAILRRFSTQAMSLGALGPEAHRTLAIAMNRLGAASNTGEGGEDPELADIDPEAVNHIKQVASARFGVTAAYLARASELEIKMAQGSKPGEGGQLPAGKVTAYIARLRHAVPGMALISPPPHHDIYSIEDLAQLIYDLRAINPQARIGVKLVSGAGVGIIAAGVAKAGAEVITICGFDGGTGASPLTSIKNTGLPWEVGLRDAHSALLRAGFRDRVRLRVDGGFKFARDVVIAALLGADEFGFGTAALLAIGCVMARQCHQNTCPAGIATQDEKLRLRFTGRPEMAMMYFQALAGEVRERLARLGARQMNEIVGATDRLRPRSADAAPILERLLATPPSPFRSSLPRREESTVRWPLAHLAEEAQSGDLLLPHAAYRLQNSDRSVGAHLTGRLLRAGVRPAEAPEPVLCRFHGVAGQSFGAFLIDGLVFRLFGEANDYVGKGLSGGVIAVTAGPRASRRGDTVAGNTILYGATSGELYVAGRAGERFAVRNSGALAVVEGIGQHGCEYMTAGVVLLLGPAGINFGAGMTGGLAYVPQAVLAGAKYQREFVRPAIVEAEEEAWLRLVLERHLELTGSPRAAKLLHSPRRLPLARLEPVRRPCSVRETWAPILARLERKWTRAVPAPVRARLRSATLP